MARSAQIKHETNDWTVCLGPPGPETAQPSSGSHPRPFRADIRVSLPESRANLHPELTRPLQADSRRFGPIFGSRSPKAGPKTAQPPSRTHSAIACRFWRLALRKPGRIHTAQSLSVTPGAHPACRADPGSLILTSAADLRLRTCSFKSS